MGDKCRIKPDRDRYGEIIGDADEEDYKDVHAYGWAGSDPATACGMPFVDEGEELPTNDAVSCGACINVLDRMVVDYKKRKNGKWY